MGNIALKETIEYLQEDNNAAIEYWQSFLVELIPCVISSCDFDDGQRLKMIEELSNLRMIMGSIKRS